MSIKQRVKKLEKLGSARERMNVSRVVVKRDGEELQSAVERTYAGVDPASCPRSIIVLPETLSEQEWTSRYSPAPMTD